MLTAAGTNVGIEPPSYRHLVSQYLDSDTVRKEVLNTIQVPKIKLIMVLYLYGICVIIRLRLQKVHEITSAFYNCGTSLSRSASSVGEHQSNVYVSPMLPKRAETFGGFDNTSSCKGDFQIFELNYLVCSILSVDSYW